MATSGHGQPVVLAEGPVVLHDGAVVVPGAATSLLADLLRAVETEGRLHPWLRPVADALRKGAVRVRRREAHIAGLESRAAAQVLAGQPRAEPPKVTDLSVEVVAERLGVTASRVKQLLGAGQLEGRKDDAGRWRISPEAVDRFRRN